MRSQGLARSSPQNSDCSKEGKHHVQPCHAILVARPLNIYTCNGFSCADSAFRSAPSNSPIERHSSHDSCRNGLHPLVAFIAPRRCTGGFSLKSRRRHTARRVFLHRFPRRAVSGLFLDAAPFCFDLRKTRWPRHHPLWFPCWVGRMGVASRSGASCRRLASSIFSLPPTNLKPRRDSLSSAAQRSLISTEAHSLP